MTKDVLRELAVERVDARHGYTLEFAADPAAHTLEYLDEQVLLTGAYVLRNDAGQFWPREGISMLPSSFVDAEVYSTRREALTKKAQIHARNPKGPFPWTVVAVEDL